MRTVFLFICCIWCHILDDYVLQGILAKMKQKSWWEERVSGLSTSIYRHDYLVALVMHSMSWAFSIMIPLMVVQPTRFKFYVVAFL